MLITYAEIHVALTEWIQAFTYMQVHVDTKQYSLT